MSGRRKAVSLPIQREVLHEAGYRCANPACRTILTLQIHHLDPVASGGGNTSDNLLALCPNCHALHHQKTIPAESLKTWKMLLLSLNAAFDRLGVDVLLAMPAIKELSVTGDGFLQVAGLVTGGYLHVAVQTFSASNALGVGSFKLRLTKKGEYFIEAWKRGDQRDAIEGALTQRTARPEKSSNRS